MTPRTFGIWSTVILIGFGIITAFVNWQTTTVLTRIRDKRADDARVAAQISSLNQAKADITAFAKEAPQLTTKLPTQEAAITLLSEQAKAARVTLTFGNTAPAANGEFPVILTITAESRPTLHDYLSQLETSFPVIKINRVSVSNTNDKAAATLDGIVYTQ